MPRAQRTSRRRAPAPASSPVPPADQALARAAEVVGDRWSLLVVSRLLQGPRRFGELLDELDGLAPNILARRLAALEADGLVVGEPYSTRPVRHAYRLTAPGAELAGALRMLAGWGAHRHEGRHRSDGVPRHGVCGTPLEARWFCGTCDHVVDDPGADADPGPGDGLVWV